MIPRETLRRFWILLVFGGVLIVVWSCGRKKASADRVAEVAMVLTALAETEVQLILEQMTANDALNCLPKTNEGCSRWCDDSQVQQMRSCDIIEKSESQCGSRNYNLSKKKSYFSTKVSGLSASDQIYSGSLPIEMTLSAQYIGPEDVDPVSLKCAVKLTGDVSASALGGLTLSCLDFSCSVGGDEIPCNQLQTALHLHSCSEDSGGESGSGGGDGSGESTPAGSCLLNGSTRCQDYTGLVWTSATIQQVCTSPNTYQASACSSEGRVGSCTVNSGGVQETIIRFYAPDTAVGATAICSALSGTFTAD